MADLARSREIEAARAVVEERRIGRAQRERHGAVRFVTRRADRVVAELLRLQPASGVVAQAAVDLRAPERVCIGCGRGRAGRARERAQCREQMLLERMEIGGHRRPTRWRSLGTGNARHIDWSLASGPASSFVSNTCQIVVKYLALTFVCAAVSASVAFGLPNAARCL